MLLPVVRRWLIAAIATQKARSGAVARRRTYAFGDGEAFGVPAIQEAQKRRGSFSWCWTRSSGSEFCALFKIVKDNGAVIDQSLI
jgi:hypothetical protein